MSTLELDPPVGFRTPSASEDLASADEVSVGSPIEVGERRRGEHERSLRDKWHEVVLGNTSDLISTHTRNTAFVFASGACLRLLGYQPEELLGRPIFDFVHPDDMEPCRQT
jgi:PAS domain-containing protein